MARTRRERPLRSPSASRPAAAAFAGPHPGPGGPSARPVAGDAGPAWAGPAAWLVVAAFGVTLLTIAIAFHPVGDYYTESDFYGGYAAGARAIAHGIVDPSRYPVVGPGYEFTLALLGVTGADLFTIAKLLSVACATATLALWRVLLRRRAGGVAAFWVTALLASNPVLVRYGYSATTDMLGTFLASASVFVLLGTRGARAPLAAGALAALAALTRYNLAALAPAAVIVLAVLEPGARGRGRAVAAYLGGFAAVAMPWAAYSLAVGHVPGISLYRNFGFYINPDPSRNVQDEYGFLSNARLHTETLLELLRTRPLELLRRSAVNLPLHLWRDVRELLGIPVAALCALGAALALGPATRRALAAVWVQGALLFLALVPVFYSDRYSMPLAPVYLTLAGAFVAGQDGIARRIPGAARALAGAAACVALVAWCVPYQRNVLRVSPVETRDAGRVLAGLARPGERVVSRKGHIGYYSGLQVEPFPRFHTLQELAGYARDHHAQYLYFSWYEALLRQEFAYLLDTTATIPGLTPLYVTTHNPSVLYRIGPGFGLDPAWAADSDARRVHVARALVRVLPDSLVWTHRLVLAADALARGDAAGALREAELATRIRPANALGWALQGEALRQMDRNAQARIAFERALAIDPGDPQARVGLGLAALALGDTTAADSARARQSRRR